MDGEPKPRRLSLAILRMAPGDHGREERSPGGPILHSLPPQPPDPDGGCRQCLLLRPPARDGAQFLITCDELPGIAHVGDGEDEVLALTRLTIEEALRAAPPLRR